MRITSHISISYSVAFELFCKAYWASVSFNNFKTEIYILKPYIYYDEALLKEKLQEKYPHHL